MSECECKKEKSEHNVIYTILGIFLLIMIVGAYSVIAPEVEKNKEAIKEFEMVESYYSDNDEVVDRIVRERTGVGYDYKSHFPDGKVHYIKVDGKNVNVILEIEEDVK